ncbi:MAG TPA: ferritin-like domain-containing protein [Abditibacteriaceae bacterium]|jgi:rubrerythrin
MKNQYGRNNTQSRAVAKALPKEDTSRRDLLAKIALTAGGVALATAIPAHSQTAATPAAPTRRETEAASLKQSDIGILNFALTLEYLEADFYSRAVEADTRNQFLRGRLRQATTSIRDHELAHVAALTATITKLGGAPVARPQFQFPADAFISPIKFAQHAVALESIGVGAYLGAVSLINDREIRRAAAGIYGSETRHVAILRHLSGFNFSTRYYEGPLTAAQVTTLIAPYMA